jgi:hypothetical protein
MPPLNHVLLALVVFLLVLPIIARWRTRRRAKKTLTQQKAIYSGEMEFADASPRDFPWLDESFYDDVSDMMRHSGFRFIADLECVTATRQFPGMRTFLRCFIGDADTTAAATYHVRLRGKLRILALLGAIPKEIRAIEFETEFTDRTFLCTNNLAGRNPFADCPAITSNQLDYNTPFDELLAKHRETFAEILATRGVEPICIHSRQDALASQSRMHAIKSAHRKQVGYVTPQQFEQLAGHELTPPQQDFVREFEKLRDRDESE